MRDVFVIPSGMLNGTRLFHSKRGVFAMASSMFNGTRLIRAFRMFSIGINVLASCTEGRR